VAILSEAAKQTVRQLKKDASGAFSAPLLPVGTYTVKVNAAGFAPSKFTGVEVRITELSKCVARECGTTGVHVNVICPGPSSGTALMENLTKAHAERQENLVKKVPPGRVGDPDDVARAAIWLCSNDTSFITGHALSVDGGLAIS
jgi:short-subunit dehydrogenase